MADVLLNKVINDEIKVDLFVKWLLKKLLKNEDVKEILSCNVAQIDFITHFLNFIHEEVPCHNKLGETPQKVNTPKRIDKLQFSTPRHPNSSVKSNLFRNEVNIVPDENNISSTTLENSVGKFSTPKISKTPSNKNSSYFSPVSPLYQNQNSFNSKDTRNENGSRKSVDKYSLCFGDFIVVPNNSKGSSKKKKVHIQSPEKKKETSRRIKPTSIVPKQINSDFQKTENSFNFEKNIEEVPVKTITEQRSVLVEERLKLLSRKDSLEKNSNTMLIKRHNSLSRSDIVANVCEVTFKSHIDCVASIYTTILENKMVLNITSEIYFLISLLLSKPVEISRHSSNVYVQDNCSEESNLGVDCLDPDKKITECVQNVEKPVKSKLYNSEMFETIHNIVYFAIRCLETQIEIIKLYDKTTIRLLAENERLQCFSPSFSKKLLTYAENKAEKRYLQIVTPTSQLNVCFNMDTDNKENFMDQGGFHAFRKQRDLFYEILRIWETGHLSSDWNFSVRLAGKIKTLFSLNWEPTNYMHVARLFKNQLLSSCAKGPKEKGLSENNLSFLPSVPIDADKLNRLTNRLVTKQSSNGINSLPVFNGYQEFYRDFIIVASNYCFNKHLCDNLISEIVELNDTVFCSTDIDDGEHDVDLNTSKQYVNCITNLRILAKFLGFVESLPYRSEFQSVPKNILESQIKIREQCTPPLDTKQLLNRSVEKNTLILLIPWLTKYLAMLDYVTIRLPYYNSVHKTLFDLYQNYDNLENNKYNIALVKFCLGWLFELPHFPDSEYFNFCLNTSDTSNYSTSEGLTEKVKICNGINGTKVKLKTKTLDRLKIVNQSVLYLCCPYLEEIKRLLSANACSSKVAVKYITPVTAVESNSQMVRKKLEQQLEEAFFNGQPTSLRKTIEFVSERIASTAVKYVCHDLVPKSKETAVKDLRENLLKNDKADMHSDDTERKTILRKRAISLAENHLSKLLQTCDNEVANISNQKIPPSIDSLLPIDTLEETKHVCISITTKMYTERVKQWVNSHVTLTVFIKDFDSEIQKMISKRTDKEKAPFLLQPGGRDSNHNEDCISGFHILNRIREACCDLIEKTEITEGFVENVLQETYKSLSERNDVNDMITVIICNTLFDFCLLLVSNLPSIFSKSNVVLDNFAKIWRLQPKTSTFLKTLVCSKNIAVLQRSTDLPKAWDTYAKVLSYLVNNELIERDDMESQFTGFFSRDWDKGTLENFSNFLKTFVSYSECDTTDGNFAYLLDFLSDFCSDL